MNPTECSPRDWPLYYNGCFMSHTEHGLVFVMCEDGEFHIRRSQRGGQRISDPQDLSPIWPSAAAINLGESAAYIGRRARREARRSATPHHYIVVWSNRWSGITHNLMQQLWRPDPYPTIENAFAWLRNGERGSVAVTRDLIFTAPKSGSIGVLCRGESAGVLQEDNGRYSYISNVSESPIARRVAFKLQKEGVLCH